MLFAKFVEIRIALFTEIEQETGTRLYNAAEGEGVNWKEIVFRSLHYSRLSKVRIYLDPNSSG